MSEKVFNEEQAIELIKKLIESGAVQVFGSTTTTYSAEEAGEQDATYLKSLFASLTSEYKKQLL